jgi:hypothetical protein
VLLHDCEFARLPGLQLATFFKLAAITTIIAKSPQDRRFTPIAVCCAVKMIAYAMGMAPAVVRQHGAARCLEGLAW